MKRLFLAILMGFALNAHAQTWEFGYFNPTKLECRLVAWHGQQPSNGILTVPATTRHSDGRTYKVVAIGDHALDNLTSVKEIQIPQYVDSIGNAGPDIFSPTVRNFENCPRLEKFTVDTANKSFSSSAAGMLLTDNTLLSVPANMATGMGTFTVPEKIRIIERTAFSQNTTIKFLTLYANVIISRNGGINGMAQLESIRLTGSGSLTLVNDALVDTSSGGRVVAFPRASKTEKVAIGAGVKNVEQSAFYKCLNLKLVTMEAVQEVGESAFAFSNISSISFPASTTKFGKSALEGCANLQYIKLAGKDIEIPVNFARDCSQLKQVESVSDIKDMNRAAFKNCSSLSSFPFSASTKWSGDSSLYGCDIKQIYFSKGTFPDSWLGNYQFAENKNMVRIDASAVDGGKENPFCLWDNMASGNPLLTTLHLPAFAAYQVVTSKNEVAPFGKACALSRITCHTLWSFSTDSKGNTHQYIKFYYSGGSSKRYTPDMFIAVSANRTKSAYYNSWGLKGMFLSADGAVVRPNVYVDAREPSKLYEDACISYFVPGGCSGNYSLARSIGANVVEMYGISFAKDGDKLQVKVTTNNSQVNGKHIIIQRVSFDGVDVTPNGSGMAKSTQLFENVSEVVVKYSVDGVSMETPYPKELWQSSGVDSVVATEVALVRSGDLITIMAESGVDYSLFDTAGHIVSQGNGNEIDLSPLAKGLYILQYMVDGQCKVEKIMKR